MASKRQSLLRQRHMLRMPRAGQDLVEGIAVRMAVAYA